MNDMTPSATNFDEFTLPSPTYDDVAAEYAQLNAELDRAATGSGAIAVYVLAVLIASFSDLSALVSQYEITIGDAEITDVKAGSGLYVTAAGSIGYLIAVGLQYFLEQRNSSS